MKKLIFCFPFLVFSVAIVGQPQPDTLTYNAAAGIEHLKIRTYYPGGELRQLGFYSKKAGALSKQEAFMRGLKVKSVEDQLALLYPTGQLRSEIDLKGFRKGQYVVEAVDFGAKEKKYCKIRID